MYTGMQETTNMTDVIESVVERDITTICRTCLKNDGTVSIFSESEAENEYTLQERIMSFAYVEIYEGDGLPSHICKKCLIQINRAFKFKAQCEYGDAWLRQLLSAVTNEDDDGNDDGVKEQQLSIAEFPKEELIETEGDVDQPDSSDSEAVDLKVILPLEDHPTSVADVKEILPLEDQPPAAAEDAGNEELLTETTSDILVANDIPLVIWKNGEFVPDESGGLPLQIIVPAVKQSSSSHPAVLTQRKKATKPAEGSYKCVFCDKVFALQGSLVYHLREHEPTGEFRCIECGRAFPHEILLDFHIKTHTAERPFCCSHCGKCFMQLSTLTSHERNHGKSKAFLCSHCGKLLTNRREHICPMIHDRTEKIYQCNDCGKKFLRRSTLVTHSKRHGLVERYRCKTCYKPFYSRQELLRHTNVHLGIRPFVCDVEECDHTFYTQGELNRHLRYHRGEKKFQCDLCSKTFYESGHLVNHRRKHTGERPFVCDICSKGFMDASKLKRHIGIHSGNSTRRSSKYSPQDSAFGEDLTPDHKNDQSLDQSWSLLNDGVIQEETVEIQNGAALEFEETS